MDIYQVVGYRISNEEERGTDHIFRVISKRGLSLFTPKLDLHYRVMKKNPDRLPCKRIKLHKRQ